MKKLSLAEKQWVAGRGYRKQRLLGPADLVTPGALVQQVVIAPGEQIPDHLHHQAREFYYVLAGTCRLVVNDTQLRLQEGDMLLMEPGDVHRLYNDGPQPFRLLVFKTGATDHDTEWPEE